MNKLRKSPIWQLNPGQSLFIPNGQYERHAGVAYYIAKQTGYKYKIRTVSKNGIEGLRITCVEVNVE